MRRVVGLVLIPVLAVGLASGCKLGGASKTPTTCKVGDRTTTNIRVDCYTSDGKLESKQDTSIPSDLYMKCQIGQPWPECKEK